MRLYYNLYPKSPCFSPIKLYIINTPITSKLTFPLKSFPPSQACRMMTSSLQHAKSNSIQLNFVLTLLLSHWPRTLFALTFMSFLPPRHALGISSTKCAAPCMSGLRLDLVGGRFAGLGLRTTLWWQALGMGRCDLIGQSEQGVVYRERQVVCQVMQLFFFVFYFNLI